MSSMLETNRYYSARRFLQAGQRELALVIAGELLRSSTGRELALNLLSEMYPDRTKGESADGESLSPGSEINAARATQGPEK